jgi:hypothetical protein
VILLIGHAPRAALETVRFFDVTQREIAVRQNEGINP